MFLRVHWTMRNPKALQEDFHFLQELVDQWWENWYLSVFPSLVPSYKWLQKHQNVNVGDVCLIKYQKETSSTHRLGRVKEVKVGSESLVWQHMCVLQNILGLVVYLCAN